MRDGREVAVPRPTGDSMKQLTALAAALGFAIALPAIAQTKWDLPTAYPATNFHTENIMQFVADVDKASAGKLKIQVHPAAALFKAPEIKRAVQGGQAQAGEILLVNYENEDPYYGIDGIPFLATSYAESQKLYKASRRVLDEKLAKQGMKLLYTFAQVLAGTEIPGKGAKTGRSSLFQKIPLLRKK